MYVRDVRCISLGVVQKEAGEYQGKVTPAYTALSYVVVNEHESRRAYLNDSALIAAAFKYCGKWGRHFVFQVRSMHVGN